MANPRLPHVRDSQLFEILKEIKADVQISLAQGRENGEQVRKLRLELGLDGQHGRLPQLEECVRRLDLNQPAIEQRFGLKLDALESSFDVRLKAIETADTLARGKKEFVRWIVSFVCSSGAVALVGWLAHQMGLLH